MKQFKVRAYCRLHNRILKCLQLESMKALITDLKAGKLAATLQTTLKESNPLIQ